MAAEGDVKPTDLSLQSAESLSASGNTKDGNNGLVVDSPDETFSPTSVIFFKEALNSCNLRFGGGSGSGSGSVSPTPLRQYEFHIERKKSKKGLKP
ncbi:hypothetical protein NHX12_034336 [Muraenolepis orangiensis]|uniref:Uncharacterized protein n=1 Tax=Muraenolepis orangiensis TaxID=630683 RepID=A0A9Q0D4B6_9TELE|nr:hypothetical protein NHX12_034336 [Muraenolepis orangiensis]